MNTDKSLHATFTAANWYIRFEYAIDATWKEQSKNLNPFCAARFRRYSYTITRCGNLNRCYDMEVGENRVYWLWCDNRTSLKIQDSREEKSRVQSLKKQSQTLGLRLMYICNNRYRNRALPMSSILHCTWWWLTKARWVQSRLWRGQAIGDCAPQRNSGVIVLPSANVFDSHAASGFALQVRANKVWPVHTGRVGYAAYWRHDRQPNPCTLTMTSR